MLFLLMGIGQLQAQEWNFGIKGGINIANFTGSDADDMEMDSRIGFHAGGLIEGKFSETFGTQLEILYNSAGAKWEGLIEDEFGDELQGKLTFKLDYISVPILVKYFPLQNMSLETGPQISFELNSEIEAEAEGVSITLDPEDETKKVDFAWAFGIGYDLPYGFLVQGRYYIGLSDIYDESNMKHSVIQFSVGYKF